MNRKMSKRQKDIKSKLMAAVAMLLVSSIMMVSTTYAWFTLSTAPEVTGITTAVGANGNLEMALQPYSGDLDTIQSAEGDSLKVDFQRNITWGNLVNVSDNASYGMNQIVLYPAKLNTSDNTIAASPLSTPKYGADGRVSQVVANTITGAYDPGQQQFAESMTYQDVSYTGAKGVRAIGVASSMSPRELAHRNALATAISEKSGANADAGKTLNTNGSAVGNIAVKHGLGNDGAGYTSTEIQPLKNAVNDLDAIAARIEKSLKSYLLANSIAPASAEATYADIVTNINNAASLEAAEQVTGAIVPTDAAYTTAKAELADLKANINTAKGINDLTGDSISWTDLSAKLTVLVNMDDITVQGMKLTDIQKDAASSGYTDPDTQEPIDGKSELINRVSNNNLVAEIVMPTGSGVFADIADFTGNYSASFKMKVAYGGVSINANAEMYARTTVSPNYLDAVGDLDSIVYVNASGTSVAQPITTFYGYIIDLAFRTNASNSNLQLQSEAVDRIYTDGTNTNTMGHGATMSFKTDSTTFGQAGVKALMENIRVVFFDTSDKTIIGYARLDNTAATNDGDNVVMPLVMTDADGVAKTKTETVDGETKTVADPTIMALEQNVAQDLSVMVYLDGERMTNADIAADQAKSMYGSMNLQFSSSANLEPMNYADLMTDTGSGDDNNGQPVVSDVTTGTVTNGYAATIKHVAVGDTYKIVAIITETTGNTAVESGVTVQIGDAAATFGTVGTYSGWYVDGEATAPTGAVNVTVTANG